MKKKTIGTAIKQELAFSRRYAEAYRKGRVAFTSAGDKEFYERDTQRSLAARLVDDKALKDLEELMKGEKLKGFKVLDIGSGGGRQAKWLLKQGARKVVCLDVSKDFLELAKKRLKGEPVDFVVASAEKLPFGNNSFDMAFFSATLHRINNPKKALIEACRIAPMIALVSEPASMGLIEKFLALIGWNVEYGKLKCHRFTPEGIGKILAKEGFNVRAKRDYIWFPFGIFGRFKNNRPFLRIYFWLLKFLDVFAGSLGHNLTVFAKKPLKKA